MPALTNLYPYGSTRPLFNLISGAIRGVPSKKNVAKIKAIRLPTQLDGYFTFTKSSKLVATTESMVGILDDGDVLTPHRTGKMYFVNSVDSTTQVTLKSAFSTTTQTSVFAYTNRNKIWLPLTKITTFAFPERGLYGGPKYQELEDGLWHFRGVEYRPLVEFQWECLIPQNVDKIIEIFDFRGKGDIEVQPHQDYPVKWVMTPMTEFEPKQTAGKLIGTDILVRFQGIKTIKTLPRFIRSNVRGTFRKRFTARDPT